MRAVALLVVVAGCALTSKAAPVPIRYFSPTEAEPAATAVAPVAGRARLGRVTASAHLRYRIAHRRSDVELELHDDLRWTEYPDAYVRRALAQALFVERGVEQAVTGEAATISVEVIAFEHVERAGRHLGRVELRYELDDDRSVVAADVVTVERQAASGEITQVVAAISDALDDASEEVADRVVSRMGVRP